MIWIALLRGINVGGNNILPMKDLKLLLQELGYSQIETYIQSGNVVLCGDEIEEDQISAAVQSRFGFAPNVLAFSKREFQIAVKNNPFESEQGKTIHFYFCEGRPKADDERMDMYKSDTEEYQLIGNVFYLYAPDGIGRSKLATKIESCLGVPGTGRNLNTVNKLEELLALDG